MKPLSPAKAVLLGGTIAGALDLLFALSFAAYNGVAPLRLLQTVASGLVGNTAFSGGGGTALLGFVLHFVLSLIWAGLFLVLARALPRLLAHPMVSGLVFGAFVFLAMRLVVLPLSAFPHPVTFKPLATVLDLTSHMVLFGLPISIAIFRARIHSAAR